MSPSRKASGNAAGSTAPKPVSQWPPASSLFRNGIARLIAILLIGSAALGILGVLGNKASLECARENGFDVVTLEVAGTADKADAVLGNCTRGDLNASIGWDTFAFIPGYVVVLGGGVMFVTSRHAFRLKRLTKAGPLMLGAVVAIGALDVLENVMLFSGAHEVDDVARMHGWGAAGAATFAWPKFVLAVAVVLYLVVGLLAWIAHIPVTSSDPVEGTAAAARTGERGGIGISLSGGGVRAGTTGLGFLQELDANGVFDKASWLSAVSGGSYMAGAWTIARNAPSDPAMPADTPRPWADKSPEVDHLRRNLGYLFGRAGGAAGAIGTLLVGLAVNLAVIFTMLWLVARPLGWLVGSNLIAPALKDGEAFRVGPEHWGPVMRWGLLALGLAVLWVFAQRVASLDLGILTRSSFRKGLGAAAAAAIAAAFAMGLVLLALPALVSGLPRWIADHEAVLRTFQTITGGGIAAVVMGVLKNPVRKSLPRLGGFLVLALMLAVGAEFASGAARNGWAEDRTSYLIVLGVFGLVYYVVDPDWWSLQPYYRARLRSAYATHRQDGEVHAYPAAEEPNLVELTNGPQLLVCTTLNARGGDGRPGVPAYSLTFSARGIDVHVPGATDGASKTYLANTDRYAKLFRRWDTPRLTAMTAVGMSGAAVSSAMGRFNYGSTAALLALANVRLGMWMPNPRYTPATAALPERPGYPRRRINYLFKEMLRIHDPDDLYVYVTDGGHWENLGVVELIRRGCTEIYCLDASGSTTDSFGTFADAVTIAAQECGATITLEFDPLRAGSSGGVVDRFVERDCAMGTIDYADGTLGVLWYAKASLTEVGKTRLVAYKEKNPIFPCDPTSDQLFDLEKFECYRLLGNQLGEHVIERRSRLVRQLGIDDNGADVLEETARLTADDLARIKAIVTATTPTTIDVTDAARSGAGL
ncbi:MAG: hypothetical protein AB7L13_05145 [Acidimicrobiia bacterium]